MTPARPSPEPLFFSPEPLSLVPMSDTEFTITCPYCGEEVEIYLEPDTRGVLVQDCEVCCNPWQLRVVSDGDDRYVEVSRADGSE